jgi:streptomycin 6-kinase
MPPRAGKNTRPSSSLSDLDTFEPYLSQWALAQDGDPIFTERSNLLPVRWNGQPAMLKIAVEPEERFGAHLMALWEGDGAARVYANDGTALLLERAEGTRSLAKMVNDGKDDEASRIICAVAARLHGLREHTSFDLIPLERRFSELTQAAVTQGGILRIAAATARELLAASQEIGVLHGDLHHGNVLDFGLRGWLAIDPKGLIGERGYDFANIFCNPDPDVALAPGRLARQASIVAEAAKLERTRLLKWIVAHAGLSAAWFIGEGRDATPQLTVAEIAVVEVAKSTGN